jgi:hypothetical protein
MIVLNEEILGEKIIFLCENCYEEIHLDENGIN